MLVDQSLSHITGTQVAMDNLRRRLLVAKEKEKNQITDFLKEMSDEQREIENLMKNNKLGNWAKGQSKEIYSYTKDAYDSEMAALEQQESDDVQLQDALGRVRIGADIAEFYADPDVREALNMSGLPEDDDFGDRDGDEDF
jgi:pyridoxine/pyridoxamine 5'-phosphate oxidase